MNRRVWLLFVGLTCLGLAVSSLAQAYALTYTLGVVATCGGWIVAMRKKWWWLSDLAFAALVGAAALGAWLKYPTLGLAFGACCSLVAWDLADFQRRLERADPADDLRTIEMLHLRRILSVAGIGMLLSALALLIPLQVAFGWIFLAGLLAMIGLWRLAAWVDRQEIQ